MTTQTRLNGGAQRLLARLLFRVTGAGLLIASAGVHLDLYATGYRTIPTIGWLFLIQVIAGFVLGLVVLVTGRRLVAAAGAVFALSTLGGYLLSVQVGLFGFREARATSGIAAGLLEVLAAGPGVTGKLGTIRRNGGELQETYNGRPLYTYVGDNGPAQTNGNNINLDGGYWYDLPVSR